MYGWFFDLLRRTAFEKLPKKSHKILYGVNIMKKAPIIVHSIHPSVHQNMNSTKNCPNNDSLAKCLLKICFSNI
jgi:hypothetical protein